MDIPINAEVYCSDGLAGTVQCVIINPITKKVTDIAVREKNSPHMEILVPLKLISETTPERVQLSCTRVKLRNLESFTEVQFIPGGDSYNDFYLRTGKRLPAKVSQISIALRPVPHQPFPATAVENWQPNRIVINIQPEEGILIRFQAKRPGPTMRLSPVDMHFLYQEAFKAASPEAYETFNQGHYRIEKKIITDPQRDTALQWTRFEPLPGELTDYHHLYPTNSAYQGSPFPVSLGN